MGEINYDDYTNYEENERFKYGIWFNETMYPKSDFYEDTSDKVIIKTYLEEDEDNPLMRFNLSEASLRLRYKAGET